MTIHSDEGNGIHRQVNGLANAFSAVVVKLGVVSAYPDEEICAEAIKEFTLEVMKSAMLKGWLMQCEIFVAEDEVIPYNPN